MSARAPVVLIAGRPQLIPAGDTLALGSAPAVDADGLATTLTLRKAFAAGGGGSADDVVIYNANAPFGFRIVDVQVFVSTAVLLSTAQLRDATGGGGAAIFGAFTTAATGIAVLPLSTTATATVATNGTLVLRRSDNGIAGEVVITLMKTG